MEDNNRMRAVVAHQGFVGRPVTLKHVVVPIPTPRNDEILIKLEATSLNPLDWKGHILRVVLRPFLAWSSPMLPCTDVAGEVVKIGSGVNKFKSGDKVVAILHLLRGGGLSEYAVVKEAMAVSRPPEVSAAQGAGLPIAGLTAHAALTACAGIELHENAPKKRILVTAASGGVGQYVVQLAKLGNHHVTATCGARNIDLLKGLGADEILDYKTPEGAALASPSGVKYDAVIHCATGIPWSVFEGNLCENGGVVVDLTPGPIAFCTYVLHKVTRAKKKLVPFVIVPKRDHKMGYLVELVKEGKLKTVIDSIHPLGEAEEGWARGVQGHATGKIIVQQ